MPAEPLIASTGDDDAPLSVVDMSITVLADRSRTNGQEFTYQTGEEGMGPPSHSHDWDESFFVTRGSVEIEAGGRTVLCTAGTLAYVPAGTIHAFRFGPGGGEMLEITGERSRAVDMFTDLGREIPTGPPDVDKVVTVMGRNGATVHL